VSSLENSFELDLTWGTKVQELDLIKKKKKTLDELLTSEKISQSTHEYLDKKLTEETTGVEAQLKSLLDSMTARAQELEKQIGGLEISLANLEMYHATEEIDNKIYENQNKIILLGLEAAKQELRSVKNSLLSTLSEDVETIEAPSTLTTKDEKPVETQETEEQGIEKTTEAKYESTNEPVESTEPSQEVATESTFNEPVQSEVPSSVDSSDSSTKAETAPEY